MAGIDYTLDKFLYEVMGDNFVEELYKRFVSLETQEDEKGKIENLVLNIRDDVYTYSFNTESKYVRIRPITSASLLALESVDEDFVAGDLIVINYTDVNLPDSFIDKLKDFAKEYNYDKMIETRNRYKNFNNIFGLERELSELYANNKDKFFNAMKDWYKGIKYLKNYSGENSVNNFVMTFENKLAKFEIHSFDNSINLFKDDDFYILDDYDLYSLEIPDEEFEKYIEFHRSIDSKGDEN